MNILVLPLYGIGDYLMTTPALRNIHEQTGASITCLHMFEATHEVLEGNPHVAENIHFPFLKAGRVAGVKFLAGLRGRFDASINFYPSNRKDYTLAAFLAGSPRRIGHRYLKHDLRELNFLKNCTVMEDEALHNVEENLRLLSFLDIKDPQPYPLEIYLSGEEKAGAGQWLKRNGAEGRPLVGLHPGTSTFKGHANRRWPTGKFAGLIGRLAREHEDARFLLFGGEEENPIKDEAIEASGVGDRAVNVTTTSIRATTALIDRCDVFISNDSGLMHLAAACQVPTVAIFGPTNPIWVAPWRVRHKIVSCGMHCSPCFRYTPAPLNCLENNDFSCLRDIPTDAVLRATLGLLST